MHKRFSNIESPWIRSNHFFFFILDYKEVTFQFFHFHTHIYINNHPTTSAKLPLIVASYVLPTVSKETTSSLDHFLSLLQLPLIFLSFPSFNTMDNIAHFLFGIFGEFSSHFHHFHTLLAFLLVS